MSEKERFWKIVEVIKEEGYEDRAKGNWTEIPTLEGDAGLMKEVLDKTKGKWILDFPKMGQPYLNTDGELILGSTWEWNVSHGKVLCYFPPPEPKKTLEEWRVEIQGVLIKYTTTGSPLRARVIELLSEIPKSSIEVVDEGQEDPRFCRKCRYEIHP